MTRIKTTNDEKLMQNALGVDVDRAVFNMSEGDINTILDKEKSRKFNNELEKYQDKLESNNRTLEEAQQQLSYDINKAEIKPMFSRVLVKPFKVNPFQQMKIENGIIVDAGGYTPHLDLNPVTGKYEEQKELIVTGCVVEIGPDVKYLQEGDIIYYRVDTSVPVPFLKQGLVSLDEKQIIAVINEGLNERFNGRK